ncbi:MAG: hypothetical protein ACT6Q8_24235 [Niveispirillum sp.]|uniref:hypothetical protein n=1 Tax=Niveispirillum sp. TaxID=1917217 RepID=UPI004035D5A9
MTIVRAASGDDLDTVLSYSPRQLMALAEAAAANKNKDCQAQIIGIRIAMHADGKEFEKAVKQLEE